MRDAVDDLERAERELLLACFEPYLNEICPPQLRYASNQRKYSDILKRGR